MNVTSLRWILHLDMDAFFASVEQLDVPELRGKPVIVGGETRGVVSAASYEARAFGVRSAMPSFEARRLCPKGVFVPARHSRYAEKSREIMGLLAGFSPLVEAASIDEAFLDLTGLERLFGTVEELALRVQREVMEKSGLSCSVGLAPVKFLAKIASDMRKPGGFTVLRHADVPGFLQSLPVEKIPGVGRRTLEILTSLNVRHASDMEKLPREFWQRKLGKAGDILFDRTRGIDPRPVETHRDPKSESAENTFAVDIRDEDALSVWLLRQAERVGASLRKRKLAGRTVTLKLKYTDFTQRTRSRTLPEPTHATQRIYQTALDLLRSQKLEGPLRLIGVGVSRFEQSDRQLTLLPDPAEEQATREDALDAALDAAREKFGKAAVVRGKVFSREDGG